MLSGDIWTVASFSGVFGTLKALNASGCRPKTR